MGGVDGAWFADKALESSAERRIRALMRQLTLDLFRRAGLCWEVVKTGRDACGIAVEVGLSPLIVPIPDCLLGHMVRAQEELIPDDCKPFLRAQELWIPFLARLFFFDPPEDRLLDYADLPLPGLAKRPTVEQSTPLGIQSGQKLEMMVAPPIAPMLPPQSVYDAIECYAGALLAELHNRLAPSGVDIWETAQSIVDDIPQLRPKDWTEFAYETVGRSCIIVRPETTEGDVRNAFRLLRHPHGEKNRRTDPPQRDPLMCVQCAVWRDRFGWSLERIGKHFGWAIQRKPAQKPSCETARHHVNEGRRILNHNSAAA